MTRSCRAFAFLAVFLLAPAAAPARQPPPEPPPHAVVLEAAVSLTAQELAYEGIDPRRSRGVLRGGEIFGWHDGSIRINGTLDIAGGCAAPRGISASLTGRTVRVEIEQAPVCPAVLTPHRFYARVSGLRPGRYEVEILAPRGLQAPRGRSVEVPPLRPRS